MVIEAKGNGTGRLRVGCSGYDYDEWRGVVYPADVPRRRWFECYATWFDTVEVNGTFYGLPAARTFEAWRERAPDDFCYALKLSRFGTHRKKLLDPATWLGRFVERAELLGDHLGPILAQLPPHWRADPARLDDFLAAAPARLRWTVEVRDPSWLTAAVYEVLARHGAALCWHDLLAEHPEVVTTDFVYVRFHGPDPQQPYTGCYPPRRLAAWARRLRVHLDAGLDVYAYFNNDVGGHAVTDARELRRRLSGAAGPSPTAGSSAPSAGIEPAASAALAEAMAADLAALADPARAEQERRYLKSELQHLGVSVPAIRRVARAAVRHRGLDHDTTVGVADALWAVPVHERRMAAVEVLDACVDRLGPDDLPFLERLLRESWTWALVDGLAASVVGAVVEGHPEAGATLDRWVGDDDEWLRRAALLALLRPLRRGEGDLDRFARYADDLLADETFWVRKALGWVLREVGRRHPAWVVAWLEPRVHRAAGLTVREAVKHLPPADRERLLAARSRR